MPKFAQQLFSGSRFIFWALAPFLVAFAVGLPLFMVSDWTLVDAIFVAALSGSCLALVMILWNPARFAWLGRTLCALVFLASAWHVADEALQRPTDNLRDATRLFVVIGIPAGLFALFGTFGRSPSDSTSEDSPSNNR